ncbi:dienelactone hydrolase family protein [Sanguibacter massiliensis]|uniref:dienelactone hydrolase family protein n=1 Tax=Sanguibacter massiliensis TaxID=1973217 RepID=UPI000C85D486
MTKEPHAPHDRRPHHERTLALIHNRSRRRASAGTSAPGLPDPTAVIDATEALLAWIDAELPGRTIVPVGFSQGGLMVTQLLRTQPGRFPAGVVLAGFTLAAELPGDDALAATPVLYARGDADDIITPTTVERTATWLRAHVDLTEHTYPGLAHGVSAEMLADVTAFLTRVAPAR